MKVPKKSQIPWGDLSGLALDLLPALEALFTPSLGSIYSSGSESPAGLQGLNFELFSFLFRGNRVPSAEPLLLRRRLELGRICFPSEARRLTGAVELITTQAGRPPPPQ